MTINVFLHVSELPVQSELARHSTHVLAGQNGRAGVQSDC